MPGISKTILSILGVFPAGPAVSQNPAVEQALLQSYAPIYVDCPSDIQWVRPAKGLSGAEAEWVLGRKPVVLDALEDYLRRLGLKDFNVHEFGHRMRQSNYENVPILGMAISGGGYRSGYTGTGAVRALDSRISGTNEEKIGGLLQSLTYLTGQSGGSFPTGSLPTHDWPTVDELVETWISQLYAQGQASANPNSTSPGSFASIFMDMGQKLQAGFNISTSDFLGRNFGYELLPGPRGGVNVTWSSLATQSKILNYQFPLSIVQANALEADDIVYFGYQVPYSNSTYYEFTPFEFGSWDSRVSAFTPMGWTGTQLKAGAPVNSSECVLGFDRASYVMGTAAGAWNFWEVEDNSNGTLAQFPKRSLAQGTAKKLSRRADESLFPEAELQEVTGAFQKFFNLTGLGVAYPTWPNPFVGSNLGTASSTNEAVAINFVDSTETGSALALWPLLQPVRNTTFIIAYDDNADAFPYQWLNGTSLYNLYLAASAAGLPFPIVPPPTTLMNRNYTIKPTFFGCDTNLTTTKSAETPIVMYVTNAPYSAYTNYTWIGGDAFDYNQFNEVFVNSFNILTQGNGTLDKEWTTCLGCAVIDRSLEKIGMQRTAQCEACMAKHCWDGTYDDTPPGILAPSLALNPSLSFEEWNATTGGL